MRLPFPRPLIWIVQLPEGTGTKQLVGEATAVAAECQRHRMSKAHAFVKCCHVAMEGALAAVLQDNQLYPLGN